MSMVFLDICLRVGLFLIAVSVLVGFYRLWKGPTLADRVIAIDMMTSGIIGFCALFAILAGFEAYLDIAVALSLVSFISVVALARYAERLQRRPDSEGISHD